MGGWKLPPQTTQCQGEELFELFRGLVVNVHGTIDFCDWVCLLGYTVWLDLLYIREYTEDDLQKLDLSRGMMKQYLNESSYMAMSPYCPQGRGGVGPCLGQSASTWAGLASTDQ